ncbi:shikimate dehydrogenase [Sphingomonas sp. SUN039]|uniref:shikimate dehydrogenase n=1 Tax=Sphingomonas sp. SUN039 TaxID=2937787 RepID=UPI002164B6FC|nr:shikimate dehydrogenase [Sphingomonas sp. SUN039]UVO53125.1 shikimate dehydrogenase [Sphingomonas sp. SUN039]
MSFAPSPFSAPDTGFLTGLVGRDIQASRSPWMHECEADAQGLRLVYSLYDFAARGWDETDLPRFLDAAALVGLDGVNVTHPYKQAVVPLLDGLSDGARRVGAVNTVKFENGRRIGHNTDVIGFAESIENGLPGVARARIVQMGAGGAGFATAHALLDLGVEELHIFDTDPARGAALVAKLNAGFGAGRAVAGHDLVATLTGADGLVNATPVGMANYPGVPVPAEALRPALWVADIVYFPLETRLLAEARTRGCRTLDGSGMAVYQAAAAFDIFTGRTADRARMLDSFKAFVAGDSSGGDRAEAA